MVTPRFLLGITIILQIITGIFLGLHYTSDSHGPVFIFPFFLSVYKNSKMKNYNSKREDLEEEDQGEDEMGRRVHP